MKSIAYGDWLTLIRIISRHPQAIVEHRSLQ